MALNGVGGADLQMGVEIRFLERKAAVLAWSRDGRTRRLEMQQELFVLKLLHFRALFAFKRQTMYNILTHEILHRLHTFLSLTLTTAILFRLQTAPTVNNIALRTLINRLLDYPLAETARRILNHRFLYSC